MARRRRTRLLLKALVALGILLMPIAPFMRIRNEGFGGPPGPISRSAKWQMVSYVLMPIGAGLAIASGIGLFAIDRRSSH